MGNLHWLLEHMLQVFGQAPRFYKLGVFSTGPSSIYCVWLSFPRSLRTFVQWLGDSRFGLWNYSDCRMSIHIHAANCTRQSGAQYTVLVGRYVCGCRCHDSQLTRSHPRTKFSITKRDPQLRNRQRENRLNPILIFSKEIVPDTWVYNVTRVAGQTPNRPTSGRGIGWIRVDGRKLTATQAERASEVVEDGELHPRDWIWIDYHFRGLPVRDQMILLDLFPVSTAGFRCQLRLRAFY